MRQARVAGGDRNRRLSRRFPAVALAAAVVMAALAAAAQRGDAAPLPATRSYTFFLVAGSAADPFYSTLMKGAEAAAKSLGNVTVLFAGSPASFAASTQIPYLNGAIDRHPDAILIAPADESALIAPIRRALDAGIPVATVGTSIAKPIAFTSVSTDDLAAGGAAAAALVAAIGGAGEVAAIGARPGVGSTDRRRDGFVAELKKYPRVTYAGIRYARDDPDTASDQTWALLGGHPNLRGILALDGVVGKGVAAALKATGSSGRVKLVEFDAGPTQVRALKAGTIAALVAQYPYGIGRKAVQLAYRYVTGGRAGIARHYDTGSAVITQANVTAPGMKKYLYTP